MDPQNFLLGGKSRLYPGPIWTLFDKVRLSYDQAGRTLRMMIRAKFCRGSVENHGGHRNYPGLFLMIAGWDQRTNLDMKPSVCCEGD
jgi:hypothetical protein